MFDQLGPGRFTLIVATGEFSLVGLALLLHWLWPGADLPPLDPSPRALALGALGAVPPVLILLWLLSPGERELPFMKRINEIIAQVAGQTIAALTWWQMALISLSAGVGEEVLFRGVLLPRLGNVPTGVIFGLLHAFTPAYAALVTVFGCYLGWLQELLPSLLAPILTHTLYDLIALWLLARLFRAAPPAAPGTDSDANDLQDS